MSANVNHNNFRNVIIVLFANTEKTLLNGSFLSRFFSTVVRGTFKPLNLMIRESLNLQNDQTGDTNEPFRTHSTKQKGHTAGYTNMNI